MQGAGAAPQPASPLCKAHPSVEDGPCFGLDARDAAFGTPITVTACLRAAGNAATAAWISTTSSYAVASRSPSTSSSAAMARLRETDG